MNSVEANNIKSNIHSELPELPYCKFTVVTELAESKLKKVKEVVMRIADHAENNWPDDKEWLRILPAWFIERITSYTMDTIIKNEILWDYSSWVDAMKFRGWYWYSSQITKNGFEIVIVPETLPFSVTPLEYVIYESGVSSKNIKFIDFEDI